MPELARFYGIVVRMYFDEHPPPHFHVHYQDSHAVIAIDTLELTRGSLPRRALSLVIQWAFAHRRELRDNWSRVEAGRPVVPIDPLE